VDIDTDDGKNVVATGVTGEVVTCDDAGREVEEVATMATVENTRLEELEGG